MGYLVFDSYISTLNIFFVPVLLFGSLESMRYYIYIHNMTQCDGNILERTQKY